MKIVVYFAICLLFVAGISVLTHIPSMGADSSEVKDFTLSAPDMGVSKQWEATIKKVGDYYAIPESEQKAADKKNGQAGAEQGVAPKKLTDATLVGIVQTSNPKALLRLPEQESPEALGIGESWLAPWRLTDISNDRVNWVNTETLETQVQYLFN